MVFIEKFTNEEWKTLRFALLWVFSAVAGADNKIDKKEKKALHSVIANSAKFFNDLAREIFMDIEKEYDQFNKDFDNDSRGINVGLQEVTTLLEGKIEKEIALNFKKTLIAIGVFIGYSSGSWIGSKLSDEEVIQVKKIGEYLSVTIGELEKPPNLQQIIQNISVT